MQSGQQPESADSKNEWTADNNVNFSACGVIRSLANWKVEFGNSSNSGSASSNHETTV